MMDSFWGNVKSPGWWIGVVVVGLLLNVFAVYLVRGSDWLGGSLSRRWGERTQARADARKRQIDWLRAHPHEQVMTAIEALDDKMQGIVYGALGLLVGMLGQLALMRWLQWVGIVCVLVSYTCFLTAWKKLSLAKEARR